MVMRVLSVVWIGFLAATCFMVFLWAKTETGGQYSIYVTETEAQGAVDFELMIPSPPPHYNEPLIEINKPPVDLIDKNVDIRLHTMITLTYYPADQQQDGEIRVHQSFSQGRNRISDPIDRTRRSSLRFLNINGRDVVLAEYDQHGVYYWQEGNVYIEVVVYGEQQHDAAEFLIGEMIKSLS